MTTLSITQAQIDALTRALKEQKGANAFNESTASNIFCKDWDSAKEVLQGLQPILSAVPTVGLFAGPAIAVVIAAGDAAKKAVCA
jgi:hypothetical protein